MNATRGSSRQFRNSEKIGRLLHSSLQSVYCKCIGSEKIRQAFR
jgi:hypothetical protein